MAAVLPLAGGRYAAGVTSPHTEAFLQIEPGARAAAMGGAHASVSDDALAVYWNPSGLADIDLLEFPTLLSASYARLSLGRQAGLLAAARQVETEWTVAGGWAYVHAGTIEARDHLGLRSGGFVSAHHGFLAAVGRRIRHDFSVGLATRLTLQGFQAYRALGGGLDLSMKWRPFLVFDYRIAVIARDVVGFARWNTSARDMVRPAVRIGQSVRWRKQLLVAADVEAGSAPAFLAALGAEWRIEGIPAVRVGVSGIGGPNISPSAGLGFESKGYTLDYGISASLEDRARLDHRISISAHP